MGATPALSRPAGRSTDSQRKGVMTRLAVFEAPTFQGVDFGFECGDGPLGFLEHRESPRFPGSGPGFGFQLDVQDFLVALGNNFYHGDSPATAPPYGAVMSAHPTSEWHRA